MKTGTGSGGHRCLIVTSHVEGADRLTVDLMGYDAVICADGGLQVAERLGLLGGTVPERRPRIYLLGDYDSGAFPTEKERAAADDLVVLPCVKDVTDSEAAIDYAVEHGFSMIHMLGGLGGRFDHAMGNLGMLAKYVDDPRVDRLYIEDGQNLVFMKAPGTFRLPAPGTALTEGGPLNRFAYFGLIAYGGPVEGLSIFGAKYVLNSLTLPTDTTLGVSNEVLGAEAGNLAESAEISHQQGHLLVILSTD